MKYDIVISGTIGGYDSLSPGYVRYLLSQNKDKEVNVGFCSLGGLLTDGLELNQAFKDHGNVKAHAFGCNASSSTVAMLGCKKIDIVKGSFFLIHNTSSLVFEYDQKNKEQLEQYIKDLQKTHDNLNTFDDVLAQMYSDKNGKPVEENREQMNKGNWLSANEALDFGLVDEIRADTEDEQKTHNSIVMVTNSIDNIFKDSGIPPLPKHTEDSQEANSVVDENGNPTPKFLQKTWLGLQSLFHNKQAVEKQKQNQMIKIFASVMALLSITDGFSTQEDGSISVTQDQMKKIDDRLASQKKTLDENASAMAAAADSIKKLKDEKAALEKSIQEKDEQIQNLQKGPGESTEKLPGSETKDDVSAMDLFNLVKDV